MCGIAGFFGVEADETLLKNMNQCQAHRGPDGRGVFTDGLAGLAHRRLSIIDLATGAQPMESGDGRYVIVYNGEVYNYLDLKAELEELGHVFKTDSDTEVVLEAYAEWGEKAFDKFNGMWGLAIYDKTAKKLTLCRDHFGIKPVYFARVGKGLVFASEIRPILESGLVPKKPNDKTIYRYLRFRVHEDSNETFFDGIVKLLPGEMLTISQSGSEVKSYTDLRQDLSKLAKKKLPYSRQASAKYYDELEKSVRLRLQSDVPVGTSLSGGLDSSSVAVLISKLMGEDKDSTRSVGAKQNVFSAIFPGSINDEEKYVDAATEACGKKLAVHKIKPTADEFKQDILEFVRAQEEPLISTGPYAQYKVMQEATQHVKVLLDGQGADETMAGYIPYYFVYMRSLKKQKRYLKLVVELTTSLDVLFRLARFRLADRLKFRKGIAVSSFLNSRFRSSHKSEKFEVVRDDLKERLAQDLFENSIPSLLRYEDKNTMHFSIEGRVPFLDKDLISYVFSLSDDAIIKHGWNKRILRDSLRKVLPEMIARRRNKIGFTTPEHEWFIRLKNYFYDIFLSSKFASRPYFNQDEVLTAFEGFIKGKNSVDSMAFWRLINVELWLREFFDEPEPAPKVKASDFVANDGKQLDIVADGKEYRRYPIRTEKVDAKTKLDDFVTGYIKNFFKELKAQTSEHQKTAEGKFYLFISEKIVAITQGRSYFIWDIKAGFWARTLSKFVTHTPAGIGLGSPFTMQLAIQEVGLPRIIFASIGGVLGKLVGKRGLFYILVGSNVRAIDGPTEYSVYPANVSAKLAPKDPEKVAARLTKKVKEVLPAKYRDGFAGVVVMDSNDIGRNVLGTDASGDPKLYEDIFADNPLGQAHEQTPICLVFEK
ncbi:MAG: asparagine synthase (glutamine-hydrolyzing) [Candidatus Nomurabacteria bacterium]|jgi:asparagine synthase (glutamine-hydrolysing)|nr:asparagine synthase (glutamine-hydrolyzing) [Candidatus Nomurabacteria bacterium]